MTKFLEKYGKYIVYAFAFVVVLVNFSLVFDNVVWGDEAFSVSTAKESLRGILQIVYFLDSAPPFYYILLKFLSAPFGYSIWSMHLVSVLVFAAGIIIAVTYTRKKLGDLPVISFIILSGLAYPCCEYNQEIRMYGLTFLCVFICANMSLMILDKNKGIAPWIIMTLSGVIAAYSHYYGTVTTGLLIFVTGVIYFIRNKKLSFLYGLISCVAYLLLYSPWMYALYQQTKLVQSSWWATEVTPLGQMLEYIYGGARAHWIVIPATFALFISVMITEWKKEKSLEFYGMIACIGTQALVLLFGYGVSKLINPIMELRYMYPLIPLSYMTLMLGLSSLLKNNKKQYPTYIVIGFLIILLGFGLWDFKDYRSEVKEQDRVTEETLKIIGTPKEGTVFMSTEVQHLSYTVLQCYYPGFEVLGINGGQTTEVDDSTCTNIWRFRMTEEPEEIISAMAERGYSCEYLGVGHLGKYNFLWYHYVKE